MESKIILGRILQRFKDIGETKVEGYNTFGYVRETENAVIVSRENGEDTPLPFKRLLVAIEAYQANPNLYDSGPNGLRDFGITHVTSPIWSLLHLMKKGEYSK